MVPKMYLFCLMLILLVDVQARLSINGRDFMFNGQKVFLSGTNIAWMNYGCDFGNNCYHNTAKATLENWLTQIAQNGGNSVRMWLHTEGDNSPAYDNNGFVIGTDIGNTLISDMREFLDFAQSKNILVIFTLWNGAVLRNQNTINLFYDDDKLASYLGNALKPMVAALAGHPSLGAWEIMNEPEGSIVPDVPDPNPCFDTTPLRFSGAGWNQYLIPMKNVQKFHNWQLDAIKEMDPSVIVTTGSWSEKASTDSFSDGRNYWSEECLVAAGGKPNGKLDFYQIHTYSYNGRYNEHAPFKVNPSGYNLNGPIVIGEFCSRCSESNTIEQLYDYAYNNGYQGLWVWSYNSEFGCDCCDPRTVQDAGMRHLQGKEGPGGVVNFPVN